jgi:hypothetical protein
MPHHHRFGWAFASDVGQTQTQTHLLTRPERKRGPEDWLVGRLKMLYKGKGLKDVLDNWKGIMLLDVAAKVVCAIISNRLTKYIRTLEEQNGFKARRGTIDGLFGLKAALHERKEHGLSTWVVYVDLIKAFDSVLRESMYIILSKLGVPHNLIHLIIRLHTNCVVKVKAGDADVVVDSTVGVKQGDSLAPLLFSLYFQKLAWKCLMNCGFSRSHTLHIDLMMCLLATSTQTSRSLIIVSIGLYMQMMVHFYLIQGEK